MSEVVLNVSNLAKYFGREKILKDISFSVNRGDVVAIIGPSGSGKSTLLRCLNLLETPTRGTLTFEDKPYFQIEKCKDDFVNYEEYNKALIKHDELLVETEDNLAIFVNKKIEGDNSKENLQNIKKAKKEFRSARKMKILKENFFDLNAYNESIKQANNFVISDKELNVLRSKITMVFQSFNIFNNMDVLKNCVLPQIDVLKRDKKEAREKAFKELNAVNMDDRMNYRPSQLSGGQKQRVAIARALCMDPEILLFDEPTSALDPEMVNDVLNVMKKLANEERTMIIVTHEMNFVKNVANKVIFIENGNIVEFGETKEVFSNPKSPRTKAFIKGINS
ncbi:MAG: ATP-binding cassette domain-containing protein [Bacilli bacterium]|nr:ATP-binding cassette domain-containing protein [Bacilli bacterium]MBR1581997.1 ATP-binding cassette domain-containing protein [Bacilli bacterium]